MHVHGESLYACDFFAVETLAVFGTVRHLVFFVVILETREVGSHAYGALLTSTHLLAIQRLWVPLRQRLSPSDLRWRRNLNTTRM